MGVTQERECTAENEDQHTLGMPARRNAIALPEVHDNLTGA